jgi:L-ascorbate metabolism protein UlaG (beta-lactamase superfamily)
VVPLPPDEAALALEWLGASLAVPMHFRPDSDAAARFAAAVAARGSARVHVMEPGQRVDLDELLAK